MSLSLSLSLSGATKSFPVSLALSLSLVVLLSCGGAAQLSGGSLFLSPWPVCRVCGTQREDKPAQPSHPSPPPHTV